MARERVDQFHFWCQHILPLVYDDSLSYYEVLCKLRDKLNEVIEWLDGYEDDLKAYVDQKYAELLAEMLRQFNEYKATVDARLTNMQNQIDGIEQNVLDQINELRAYVDKSVADLTDYVNKSISDLQARVDKQIADNEAWVQLQIKMLENRFALQIAQLETKIASNLLLAQNYTDVQIALLIKRIPMLQNVVVVCPVDGRTEPIQTALDHMYQIMRQCAFTCLEYDELNLTAQDFDDIGITAGEFDNNGLCLLGKPEDTNQYAFSAWTGNFITLRQNIYEIHQYLRTNGLTAQAYDALDLTANDYDTKELTAYNYDWEGIPA